MSRDLSRVFNNQSPISKLKYSLDLIDRMSNSFYFDDDTLAYLNRNKSTLQSNLDNSFSFGTGAYQVPKRKKTEIDRLIDKHQLIKSELNRENLVIAIKTFLEIQNIKVKDFILIQFKKWMNFEFELKKQKKCERCSGLINHDLVKCIHCSYVWAKNNIKVENLKAINPKLFNSLNLISCKNAIIDYEKSIIECSIQIDKKLSDLILLGKDKVQLNSKKNLILTKDLGIYSNTLWTSLIILLFPINAYLFSNIYLLLPVFVIMILLYTTNSRRTSNGVFSKPKIDDILKKETSELENSINSLKKIIEILNDEKKILFSKINNKEKLILKHEVDS